MVVDILDGLKEAISGLAPDEDLARAPLRTLKPLEEKTETLLQERTDPPRLKENLRRLLRMNSRTFWNPTNISNYKHFREKVGAVNNSVIRTSNKPVYKICVQSQLGSKVNNSSQAPSQPEYINCKEGEGGAFVYVCRRSVTINFAIGLCTPCDICFDLTPVLYTQ